MKNAVMSVWVVLVMLIAGTAVAQSGGSDPAESRDHPALNRIPCYRAMTNNTKMDQSYMSSYLKSDEEWKGDVTTILYKVRPDCTPKTNAEMSSVAMRISRRVM
jgi:hypothetical protein